MIIITHINACVCIYHQATAAATEAAADPNPPRGSGEWVVCGACHAAGERSPDRFLVLGTIPHSKSVSRPVDCRLSAAEL